ncbi:MAG: Rpn family recombination-promoting nuclease/putative transposase [Eubacteriales bacterium]
MYPCYNTTKQNILELLSLLQYTAILRSNLISYQNIRAYYTQQLEVRTMIYDGLGYLNEVKDIKHNHQVTKPKMTSGEFLGNFRKSDKLTPIITIVVYYGEEPWDGPHCLLDMMKAESLNQQEHVSKDTAYMNGSITKLEKLMTTLMEVEEREQYME